MWPDRLTEQGTVIAEWIRNYQLAEPQIPFRAAPDTPAPPGAAKEAPPAPRGRTEAPLGAMAIARACHGRQRQCPAPPPLLPCFCPAGGVFFFSGARAAVLAALFGLWFALGL